MLKLPKAATSSEKWVIICLVEERFNKKAAYKLAGVSLRRVQEVELKFRPFIVDLKGANLRG